MRLGKIHELLSFSICAVTFVPACLYPPARVVEAERAKLTASTTVPDADKNAGDVPAPAKPTGPLISDGSKPVVMNLDPGGGWFVFHDPTPSGVMTPPTIDAFASTLNEKNGVI